MKTITSIFKMKRSSLCFISFFTFHFSFFIPLKAQTDTAGERGICNSYMRTKYIFEGKIDSGKYVTVKTGEYTYANFTAYSVEVDKVIKGNIKKGTIEIIQSAFGDYYKGPEGIKSGPRTFDGPDGPPQEGLYFCWDTTRTGKVLYFKNTNAKTLKFFEGIPSSNGEIKKDPRGGLSLYFSSLSDFYAYLSTNYGIKIEQ